MNGVEELGAAMLVLAREMKALREEMKTLRADLRNVRPPPETPAAIAARLVASGLGRLAKKMG